MAESITAGPEATGRARGGGRNAFDHFASFYVIYLSVFFFLILYVLSVEVVESLLQDSFETRVERAVRVSPIDGPVVPQIQNRVAEIIQTSPWTRVGGVRLTATVIGADGQTPLYIGGRVVPPPPAPTLEAAMDEAARLLPAITDVYVAVPHGAVLSTGILMAYAAVLLQGLFFYNRGRIRREQAALDSVTSARQQAKLRAEKIENELRGVRDRLSKLEPVEATHAQEIRSLEREREGLRAKLRELGEREAALRSTAARSTDLEQEHHALEELLDEALSDVSHKDEEIQELQDRLQSSAGKPKSGKSRARESERLARRLRTLYKNLDVDDRAISDLCALGDESLKLRAEEALKKLADEPEAAAVRRKVGGLPPHLSIYEMGFAGKGRIYYMRAESGRHRVLLVGGKASQTKDLEYLSRLSN
jgi:plasmid stabilization system protein ParE